MKASKGTNVKLGIKVSLFLLEVPAWG